MRKYYLIAYDIKNPKRLQKMAKCMLNFGTRRQFSIFECVLNNQELIVMKHKAKKIINRKEDKFYIYNLGDFKKSLLKKIERIGVKEDLSFNKAVII